MGIQQICLWQYRHRNPLIQTMQGGQVLRLYLFRSEYFAEKLKDCAKIDINTAAKMVISLKVGEICRKGLMQIEYYSILCEMVTWLDDNSASPIVNSQLLIDLPLPATPRRAGGAIHFQLGLTRGVT